MSASPRPEQYGATLRAIHWATALTIVIVFGVTYVEGFFPRGSAGRATVWWTHISFGLLLIALVAARLVVRASTTAPAPSAALSRPVRIASHVVHGLLYLLLIAVPLIGVYLSFLRGNEVSFFGLFTIPSPIPVDRPFGRQVQEVHETAANILVVLAVLHAAAALVHHYVFKDDVLRRMLPQR